MENVTAVVGQHDQAKREHEINHEVECIIKHPEFDKDGYIPDYDFSLFVTKKPIKYNKYARPVCLPKESRSYRGKTMVISGWGRLDTRNETRRSGGSATLQAGEVIGVDQRKCNKAYEDILTDRMFCATAHLEENKTVDACQGDSGGEQFDHRVV